MIDYYLNELSILIQKSGYFAPALALLAGIITSFTPCSISTVPLVIGFIGSNKEKSIKRNFLYSLSYAIGLTVTFTCLGIISALTGSFLGNYNSYWLYFLGILMILMGIQTLGIFTFIESKNLMSLNRKKGILGGFILGILGGIFSSPCSTPVLIVLLAVVSQSKNLIMGIIMMLFYSLGYSFLTLVAGTFVGFVKELNKSKKYEIVTKVLNVVLALIMFLIGFYMIYLA